MQDKIVSDYPAWLLGLGANEREELQKTDRARSIKLEPKQD